MLRSEWLSSFAHFAEDLNFTRAAQRLHISQPALHVQIRRLAEAVGVPLYVRAGRSLALTREGEALRAHARDAAARDSDVRARLSGERSGPVVLSAGEGAYRYLLGPALRAYLRGGHAPLSLLTRDREGTAHAVASGEADLGVASFDRVPEGLVATPLAAVGPMLVMPRAHRLSKKRVVHLAELADLALIVPPAGRPHRTALAAALAAAGVPWRVAVEASGWDLMLHFAAMGLGLTVVNDFCQLPRGLVGRPLEGLLPVRYVLLSRAGAPRPAATLLRQAITHATR